MSYLQVETVKKLGIMVILLIIVFLDLTALDVITTDSNTTHHVEYGMLVISACILGGIWITHKKV